jgi:GTP-binding protein
VACGYEGERVTLELEPKLLPSISLFDAPNAGKSMLLRALVVGHARSTVIASTAFMTLNSVAGAVHAAEDRSLVSDSDVDGIFYDDCC